MLNVAVVMDPLESIQVDHDTTYVVMVELARRGHAVYHVDPIGVRYAPGGTVLRGRRVRPTADPAAPFEVEAARDLSGRELHAVLIRTDPPFDADYLTVTHLLDLLRPRPFLMNRPSGLRDANEKLAALEFPDLGPPTFVGSDPAELERFRVSVGGSIVLKPLDGFGGAGVVPVRPETPDRAAILRDATGGGTRRMVAQQIVPGAETGDRRVLILDGEPIGALLRRNDSGGFTHNLATGGSAHASPLTEEDRALCRRLAPWLRERGLWFVGIDLIAGQLIEINVTSPTCVQEINRLEGVALERPIVDFLESRAARAAGA